MDVLTLFFGTFSMRSYRGTFRKMLLICPSVPPGASDLLAPVFGNMPSQRFSRVFQFQPCKLDANIHLHMFPVVQRSQGRSQQARNASMMVRGGLTDAV